MLPTLSEGESFFITPSQFEIEYMYRKGNNNYIYLKWQNVYLNLWK